MKGGCSTVILFGHYTTGDDSGLENEDGLVTWSDGATTRTEQSLARYRAEHEHEVESG